MGLPGYGTASFTCNINGRDITDWGETDPPFDSASIDPNAVLRRGLGGSAVRLDRKNPGRTVTINLQPGSPDSAFLQGLMNSRANIELGYIQLGSLEAAIGTEGLIANDGPISRAGMTITDDQYIIEFNIWTGTKGGSNTDA